MKREDKIEHIKNNKPYKITDIIAVIIIVAVVLGVVIFSYARPAKYVEINYKGDAATYNLNRNNKIELKNDGGEVIIKIIIENKTVYVEDAACPTRECVHMGKISNNSQVIICSHYGAVIKITDTANKNLVVLG